MPFPSNEYNYWGHDAYFNEPFGWIDEIKEPTPEEQVAEIVKRAHERLDTEINRIIYKYESRAVANEG